MKQKKVQSNKTSLHNSPQPSSSPFTHPSYFAAFSIPLDLKPSATSHLTLTVSHLPFILFLHHLHFPGIPPEYFHFKKILHHPQIVKIIHIALSSVDFCLQISKPSKVSDYTVIGDVGNVVNEFPVGAWETILRSGREGGRKSGSGVDGAAVEGELGFRAEIAGGCGEEGETEGGA